MADTSWKDLPPLEIPEAERCYCRHCGAPMYKEAIVCPQCGAMQNERGSYHPRKTTTKNNWFLFAACIIASLNLLWLLILMTQSITYMDYLGGYGPIIFLVVMTIAVAALWTSFITKSKNGVLFSAIVLCVSPIAMPSFIPYIIAAAAFSWIGFVVCKNDKKTGKMTSDVEIPSDYTTSTHSSDALKNQTYATKAPDSTSRIPQSQSYKYMTIRVVGVTFDNEDGTNRQNILRHIRFRDPPFDDADVCAELHPYDFNGEDAIAVLVADQMIGNIPKTRVSEIMDHWNNLEGITAIDIIGGGKDEFGDPLNYGAEITIRFRS